MTWLTSAFSPIAASTAENASSTGRPAATSAPNATSRIEQRQRQRRVLGARHVLAERLVHGVVGARAPELLDRHARVRLLDASIAVRTGAIFAVRGVGRCP